MMDSMPTTDNPFTPGFGEHPPFFAGRDEPIAEILAALDSGQPTRKEYVTVLLGSRGAGKTTILSAIADSARARGWRVIAIDTPFAPSQHDGAIAMLAETAIGHLEDMNPPQKRRFAGFSLPMVGGGVRWENRKPRPATTNKLLSQLMQATKQHGGAGVLLAVDEFHNMTPPEASQIAGAIQQITKIQKQNMAFICAALPHVEHTLLREEGFTFFQRADRRRVEHLSLSASMHAIGTPLRDEGRIISNAQLKLVSEATRGLAYAIQSVGYHLWELSCSPPSEVTDSMVSDALDRMRADVDVHVVSPIWSRLSNTDRLFLRAMLSDSAPSTLVSVAKRLGSALSNPSTYKKRLLQQGAIIEIQQELHFASDAIRDRAIEEEDIATAMQHGDNTQTRETEIPPQVMGSLTKTQSFQSQAICGAWMPIAKTRCRLKKGHQGNHRSRN